MRNTAHCTAYMALLMNSFLQELLLPYLQDIYMKLLCFLAKELGKNSETCMACSFSKRFKKNLLLHYFFFPNMKVYERKKNLKLLNAYVIAFELSLLWLPVQPELLNVRRQVWILVITLLRYPLNKRAIGSFQPRNIHYGIIFLTVLTFSVASVFT